MIRLTDSAICLQCSYSWVVILLLVSVSAWSVVTDSRVNILVSQKKSGDMKIVP